MIKTHQQRVLSLYRKILHLHQMVLPIDARMVGDSFVKLEFIAHKETPQDQVGSFMSQWENYAQMLILQIPRDRIQESHSAAFLADIGMKPISKTIDSNPRWAQPKPEDYFTSSAPIHPMMADQRKNMGDLSPLVYPGEPKPMNPSEVAEEQAYDRLRNIAQPLDARVLNQPQAETLAQMKESILGFHVDPDLPVGQELEELSQDYINHPDMLKDSISDLVKRQKQYDNEIDVTNISKP